MGRSGHHELIDRSRPAHNVRVRKLNLTAATKQPQQDGDPSNLRLTDIESDLEGKYAVF